MKGHGVASPHITYADVQSIADSTESVQRIPHDEPDHEPLSPCEHQSQYRPAPLMDG